MLVLTTGQANTVDFELDLNGDVGGEIKVAFTIDCVLVALRFAAVNKSAGAWQVVIPQAVSLDEGEFDFYIDVYIDNHMYPTMAERLQVKRPFKPTAKLAAPATTTIAPPAIRMSVTTTTTTTAPAPVVREVREAPSIPHTKASTVRRVLRED
jgi:hypothetical protein